MESLTPGTVVVFLDDAGPLCAAHSSGKGSRAVWALRPATALPADRAAGALSLWRALTPSHLNA